MTFRDFEFIITTSPRLHWVSLLSKIQHYENTTFRKLTLRHPL